MVAQVIAAHCLLPGRQQTHLSVFDVSYAVWPVCYPRKKKQKKILLLLAEIQSSLCIHVR